MAIKRVTQNVNDAVNQSNLISVALIEALNLQDYVNVKMSVEDVAQLIKNALGSGGTIVVDNQLSTTSTNPVQNKVITGALNDKVGVLTTAPTTDNESGRMDIVLLSEEPSAKYNGYIYIIDTGSEPTTPTDIVGNTIMLGSEEDISNNTIELGDDVTISGNTIYF